MKNVSPVRLAISLAILAVGIGGFFWLGTPEVATRPPERKGAPLVQTYTAVEHKDGIQFEVDGVVVPYRQIDIAAQVSGRVEFKSDQCRVGRAVDKDELLLTIDQSDYVLEVTRLTEELNQADAQLRELEVETETVANQIDLAKQQLEIDERELQRQKDLVERRAASEAEVDNARRAELTTRNSLQTLRDQKSLLQRRQLRLESAKALVQANLDKAELALERTEIRAPIDGVVVTESVEQDGFVQMGSPVISLQDSSQLDVTCKLHMRQMHWLWQSKEAAVDEEDASEAYDFPKTSATVIYQIGGTKYQWRGLVNRYDGAGVDDQTRMVPCRVYVADPLEVTTEKVDADPGSNPPTLMTGMFVKVRVDAKPPIPLVRLPQEAVQPGNSVWIVDDASKLKRLDVSIATSNQEFVVAYQEADGLQAGQAVVTSPLASPLEGLSVHDLAKGPPPNRGGFGGGPPGGGGGPPGARGGGPPGGRRGPPSGSARSGGRPAGAAGTKPTGNPAQPAVASGPRAEET